MSLWPTVNWVLWLPVKVPRWMRCSSAHSWSQVWPVLVSVTRISSRASQHKVTCVPIRSSRVVVDRAQVDWRKSMRCTARPDVDERPDRHSGNQSDRLERRN